ncbi:unnamed protein product [marine sediment metagenome]|uniref:Predicted pPIWI-associating nuclease domain-containing protein n=1 Tax=marine sediment metagenome TaxID=412755 RepID=X1KBW9_9ZZZZ
MTDPLEKFSNNLHEFIKNINKSKAVQVRSKALREQGIALVQLYFRKVKPQIVTHIRNEAVLAELDAEMQHLLILTQRRTKKDIYKKILKSIISHIQKVSVLRELKISQALTEQSANQRISFSHLERGILNTLKQLIPTAALSYEQALVDLNNSDRISFRGTANELRETLRETLDHLAPDTAIQRQNGFTLEKGQTKPTMKQKVRFILKARGLSKTASKVPELSVDMVEERIASLTRSIYDRSSLSSHISSIRTEVLQLKNTQIKRSLYIILLRILTP